VTHGHASRALVPVAYPAILRRGATWVVVGLLLLVAACLWAPWQQSVSGQGRVTARLPVDREQRIEAPVSGRLVRWFAQEGARVQQGDPLLEISDLDPDYIQRLGERRLADQERLEAATARADAYSEQAEAYDDWRQLKIQAARLKVTMSEQKVKAAEQKLEAAKAERTTAQLNLERYKRLTDKGIESQRALELAELALAKSDANLNLAHAGLSEAKAALTAQRAELLQADAEGQAKVRSARAEQEKARSEGAYARKDLTTIESELARQATRVVAAPRSGTLLRISGGVGGQVVKKGDPLATLVPNTNDLAVELWVDGNDLPLVSQGSPVRLQFEGWPAVQFVGWPSVAVGSFGGLVNFVDARTDGNGKVRVVVTPDPSDQPWPPLDLLRQGVMAKGWVLLEQVPVGWELWRQFNGFPLSVPQSREGTAHQKGKENDGA
jgi:membrane fusion protein, adhesin transport system